MYKKAWCMCKVIILQIKPIVFLTFSLPSASLDLKVPTDTFQVVVYEAQVFSQCVYGAILDFNT